MGELIYFEAEAESAEILKALQREWRLRNS